MLFEDRDPDEVIERITPQPVRRGLATGFVGVLGMLLLYLAVTFPPVDWYFLALLVGMGAGALYLSYQMWEATAETLELTPRELREANGRVLCQIENVAGVDRGFFAFKPASGFIIRLKAPMTPGVYAPGLWWRFGRTLMVGGATAGRESKSVADLIKVLVSQQT